ncbi:hypothetical protein [Sanguibacter sp. HDW7]|nr:hypothetical protein [Sanguibacter sp. HDW7]
MIRPIQPILTLVGAESDDLCGPDGCLIPAVPTTSTTQEEECIAT